MADQISRLSPQTDDFPSAPEVLSVDGVFDEGSYVLAYPDVAKAIRDGVISSADEHYLVHGRAEGRRRPVVRLGHKSHSVHFSKSAPSASPARDIACSIEGLLLSSGGGAVILGWVDDLSDELQGIQISGPDWVIRLTAESLMRARRTDVESVVAHTAPHSFGFIGLYFDGVPLKNCGQCFVALILRSGNLIEWPVAVQLCTNLELREILLSHVSEAKFFGNPQVEAIAHFGSGFGENVLALNRALSANLTAHPYVERFGQRPRPPKASIIVCLYGKVEFLFLQNALFSDLPGFGDYEFIYVSNSPELAETLLREAAMASRIYGTRITIIILAGNAGFGAANNAAERAASTRRILLVNPDVFPRDLSWAQKHAELLSARPAEETRLFGVPLYYDDGSLMHGGMFFELDATILLRKDGARRVQLPRVEHYGKGAPVSITRFTRSRPVPAVTGAFMSCDRDWYGRLGGFTEDYVFGHYEDADLCLKSITSGSVPWLHDLRLWHLEGKGSTRRPVHEGGALINRWLFASRWAALIAETLMGQHPSHPLLAGDAASGVFARQRRIAETGDAGKTREAIAGAPDGDLKASPTLPRYFGITGPKTRPPAVVGRGRAIGEKA